MGSRTLRLTGTRVAVLNFIIVLCGIFAATAVYGQRTFTWTGAANGTNIATAGNWNPSGLPSGASQDTAQWDGVAAGNLALTYTGGLPDTGFGTSGINFELTANQLGSVSIRCPSGNSGNIGLFGINLASGAGAFTLGDTSANQLNLVGRPAGAVHSFVNDSANAATIAPSVRWQAGGGTAYTLAFDGTGDWIVNNYLRNDNNSGATTIQKDGSGTLTWTAAGLVGNSAIATLVLNGGSVILKSSGLLANQPIANNGTLLQYDAASQSQTLGGVISGAGPLKVSNGTLTLSGANAYTGNTEIANNGTLVVGRAENVGVSGPLGVGGTISFTGGALQFSVNNTFDYSARFSTAAGQAYKFNTAGQSVTFATGLSSSGGTLTKAGPGTVTLSGPSTYSGPTTVSGGKLVFQGAKSGAADITVADGAAVGVTAMGAQVTPGALTLGTSVGATLEFNNLSSTATAPVAAGALSSAGTVTININSGTFVVGQSYPLLTWTSGSAPTVALGTLSGAVGNLSISGNTLSLNVTGLAYVWTGGNNGNWDTATANNWTVAGSPAVFADGGAAVFDDTAAGATNVTVIGVVQPASVTVNNSSKTYSIISSPGNTISGGGRLLKNGNGALTLSGGVNAYTGVSTVNGGAVSVGTLANGGSASDIGAASSGAASLVLNGGTLLYSGGPVSIDRLFTLGTGGGALDASGSGALNLNNPGSVGLDRPGARVLTLTGASTDDNTLAAVLADSGGATSLAKSGAGKWVLTGDNAHSGGTTIANGTLQVGAGGASGAVGSGNIVDNGVLIFNRSGTLTFSGAISGTGSLTKDGSGTVIIAGNNTYSGGTTINAGTLQIGDGGASGALNGGSPVVNNGTIIFNSTGSFVLGAGGAGPISGTGQLIKRGSGLLKLLSDNTYTGGTIIDPGAQLQVCEGNQGAIVGDIVNNGSLIMVRQDFGVFIYSGNISGTGSLTKNVNNPNAGDVTFTGTNTYTGGTFILGGTIILGDGTTPGAGSLVGDVFITNNVLQGAASMLEFNRPDDLTFRGAISGNGSVLHNGSGTVTLTGANTYTGGTTITTGTLRVGAGGASGAVGSGNITDNGVLVFDRSDAVTFGGAISGTGSVEQQGPGTLTLGATTYTGNTTVSKGTLVVNGDNAAAFTTVSAGTLGGAGTFAGSVTLEAGTTLAPGPSVGSVGTLTINSDLSIGGNLAIELNKSLAPPNDLVVVSGVLTGTGTGTLTVANLGPALAVGDKFTLFSQPLQNGAALTVAGAGATWANNLAVDGSITVNSVIAPPALNFTEIGNSLRFSWTDGFYSFKLQAQTNSLSVGITTNWVDYPFGGTSPVTVPIDVTNGTVFFRLVPKP
jgi:autotransporter-associated beta strand protein